MEVEKYIHDHQLILRDKKKDEKINCSACKLPISGEGTIYSCNQCIDFIIHKSCTQLPHQIQHPFHPLHPLNLFNKNPSYPETHECHACSKLCFGFVYYCAECKFHLDVPCASLSPTIKYKGHKHILTLFDKIYRYRLCNACRKRCDGIVFHCVECEFNLHVHCFPSLPRVIKHECHIDHLILTDSIEDEEGCDEFYCDACEQLRHPTDPVYYCAECQFVAEIKCVVSEVLSSLLANQESDGEGTSDKSVVKDPILVELDEKIAELDWEIETLTTKLGALAAQRHTLTEKREALEGKGSPTMPISRDGFLSEASVQTVIAGLL